MFDTALPHIMLIITKAERGGAQTHVLDLLSFRTRARLTVVSGEDGFLLEEARALGLKTVVVPALVAPIDPRRDLSALLALVRLLQRSRPDLVHLHSSKAGLLGRLAAALTGIPAVFTAHGWAFTEGASPARRQLAIWLERLVAPLSGAIVAVSDYDRELAIKLQVTRRAQTIHNALPEAPISAAPPSERSSDRLRLLMVARFSPPKDQATLLRAAATLPETEVWLIGDGELRPQVQALAEELGLGERVKFLGNRKDVAHLLTEGDIFCLCSNYEGFPISILEAMRAGLPVTASNVGGVREAVVAGETGMLVDHNDPVLWRLAILRLLDDPGLRRRMGQAGQARFEAHFTTAPMLEHTWAVYRQVLRARPGSKRLNL